MSDSRTSRMYRRLRHQIEEREKDPLEPVDRFIGGLPDLSVRARQPGGCSVCSHTLGPGESGTCNGCSGIETGLVSRDGLRTWRTTGKTLEFDFEEQRAEEDFAELEVDAELPTDI